MGSDTKAIIGTIVGTGLVVAGLLAGVMYALIAGVNTRFDDVRIGLTAQIAGLNTRIDDVNTRIDDINTRFDDLAGRMDRIETRMDRIETRLDGFDARLRNVEIALGKVDQRLLTLERVFLPPREPAGE